MTARHAEVADDLRRRITSGAFPVGARLPPETRLAAQYGVSTPTLRDALEVLRAEGLVAKFQGRGNFVSTPPDRLTYLADVSGLRTRVSSADVTATDHLAARLGMSPGSPLTEYVCPTHHGESPYVLARVYVPRTTKPLTVASPWGDDLLTTAGVPVATSTDQVTARFPTTTEAQSLRIGTRTPVLAIERTFTAADGHILGYALLVLPGDRSEVALITHTDPDQKAHP